MNKFFSRKPGWSCVTCTSWTRTMPRQLSVVRRFGNWFNIVWNSILSGVASQPTQPSVPSEASRDPIHLGWLRAAGAGEQKLSDVDEDTICIKYFAQLGRKSAFVVAGEALLQPGN